MFGNTLDYILQHPMNRGRRLRALWRFGTWQLRGIWNKKPIVYNYTEHSKIYMWKGLQGATGNLYAGLAEFEDMGFLLHFLREGDLFFDIGANVGAYTILASAEIKARTISIEPIPLTYQHLVDNIELNEMQSRVTAMNIGLGAELAELGFTNAFGPTNHVVASGEIADVQVPIAPLDSIATEAPLLMKIDVEGFETEVLKGGSATLRSTNLKAIIIELNGSGKHYGYDEGKIHELLLSHEFQCYEYNPIDRSLIARTTAHHHNTLYVRDLEWVRARLKSARKVLVDGRAI